MPWFILDLHGIKSQIVHVHSQSCQEGSKTRSMIRHIRKQSTFCRIQILSRKWIFRKGNPLEEQNSLIFLRTVINRLTWQIIVFVLSLQWFENFVFKWVTISFDIIISFWYWGHGFESRWSPDIFRLLPSNCVNWKIYRDDHSSLSPTTAVKIWISYLFHIFWYVTLSTGTSIDLFFAM